MTGGVGAGVVPAAVTAAYVWPPAEIEWTGVPVDAPMLTVAQLPRYTPTGSLITLPAPTFAGATATVDAGNGVAAPAANTQSAYVPIANCQYIDTWTGNGLEVPANACGAQAPLGRRDVPEPLVTPPPS